MSERVCIVHHLQEMWSPGYENHGTSFEQEAEKILDYLKSENFDRVILVLFEDNELEMEHFDAGLEDYIDQVEEYGYGWERESLERDLPEGEGTVWADGCEHSEVVMLDDWIKSLKGKDVTLTGAFENKCIETLSVAMEHCEVEFKREEGLIVGTGVSYEFRCDPGMTQDDLCEQVEQYANDQYSIGIKTPKEAMQSLLGLVIKTDYDNLQDDDVVNQANDKLFGFCEDDTVCISDESLLVIDDELYDEAEALDLDEVDVEEIQPIQATFNGQTFEVDGDDYRLLKVYRDIGVSKLPVHVTEVSINPFEYSGVSVKDETSYERFRHAARRKTDPTPGAALEA